MKRIIVGIWRADRTKEEAHPVGAVVLSDEECVAHLDREALDA